MISQPSQGGTSLREREHDVGLRADARIVWQRHVCHGRVCTPLSSPNIVRVYITTYSMRPTLPQSSSPPKESGCSATSICLGVLDRWMTLATSHHAAPNSQTEANSPRRPNKQTRSPYLFSSRRWRPPPLAIVYHRVSSVDIAFVHHIFAYFHHLYTGSPGQTIFLLPFFLRIDSVNSKAKKCPPRRNRDVATFRASAASAVEAYTSPKRPAGSI